MTAVRALATLVAALALVPSAPAQDRFPTRFTASLARHPAVARALAWLEGNFPAQVEEWIRITEIPAPSGGEGARAAYVREVLAAEGLEVEVDSAGNVTARRRGQGGGPTVVFAAHLDTVHPESTDVRVKRDGPILRAPGVFDNSASVANMLAAVRALRRSGLTTRGDLIFLATVREETGLEGMAHWLDRAPRPDMVVALDGGAGPVMYGALGIYWTRYTFSAQGAHTLSSRGRPHPVRALAAAVRAIDAVPIPPEDRSTVINVGMIRGGTVVNAIPPDASFTMDLRSVDPARLAETHAAIERAVAAAAAAEGVGWSATPLSRQAAGGTEEALRDRRAHPLVQTAVDVHRHLRIGGDSSRAVASGSTDANVAVLRGIPAVSIGRARGGDQHTLAEWAESATALPSTKAIVLLAAALAGLP